MCHNKNGLDTVHVLSDIAVIRKKGFYQNNTYMYGVYLDEIAKKRIKYTAIHYRWFKKTERHRWLSQLVHYLSSMTKESLRVMSGKVYQQIAEGRGFPQALPSFVESIILATGV